LPRIARSSVAIPSAVALGLRCRVPRGGRERGVARSWIVRAGTPAMAKCEAGVPWDVDAPRLREARLALGAHHPQLQDLRRERPTLVGVEDARSPKMANRLQRVERNSGCECQHTMGVGTGEHPRGRKRRDDACLGNTP
jgi:hypothetical protein